MNYTEWLVQEFPELADSSSVTSNKFEHRIIQKKLAELVEKDSE